MMDAACEDGNPAEPKWAFKWLFVLLGMGVLAIAAPLAPWGGVIQSSRTWFDGHPVAGPMLYFLFYVAGGVFFLPGSLLTIGAGFLFGLAKGFIISLLASVLAAGISFLTARSTAERPVWKRLRSHRYFCSINHAIGEKGPLIVGLLRLSPFIHFGIGNCLYGLTSIRFWPYLAATALGLLPGILTFAYLGHASGPLLLSGQEHQQTPLELAGIWIGLAVTVGVTAYLSGKARRYLDKSL